MRRRRGLISKRQKSRRGFLSALEAEVEEVSRRRLSEVEGTETDFHEAEAEVKVEGSLRQKPG